MISIRNVSLTAPPTVPIPIPETYTPFLFSSVLNFQDFVTTPAHNTTEIETIITNIIISFRDNLQTDLDTINSYITEYCLRPTKENRKGLLLQFKEFGENFAKCVTYLYHHNIITTRVLTTNNIELGGTPSTFAFGSGNMDGFMKALEEISTNCILLTRLLYFVENSKKPPLPTLPEYIAELRNPQYYTTQVPSEFLHYFITFIRRCVPNLNSSVMKHIDLITKTIHDHLIIEGMPVLISLDDMINICIEKLNPSAPFTKETPHGLKTVNSSEQSSSSLYSWQHKGKLSTTPRGDPIVIPIITFEEFNKIILAFNLFKTYGNFITTKITEESTVQQIPIFISPEDVTISGSELSFDLPKINILERIQSDRVMRGLPQFPPEKYLIIRGLNEEFPFDKIKLDASLYLLNNAHGSYRLKKTADTKRLDEPECLAYEYQHLIKPTPDNIFYYVGKFSEPMCYSYSCGVPSISPFSLTSELGHCNLKCIKKGLKEKCNHNCFVNNLFMIKELTKYVNKVIETGNIPNISGLKENWTSIYDKIKDNCDSRSEIKRKFEFIEKSTLEIADPSSNKKVLKSIQDKQNAKLTSHRYTPGYKHTSADPLLNQLMGCRQYVGRLPIHITQYINKTFTIDATRSAYGLFMIGTPTSLQLGLEPPPIVESYEPVKNIIGVPLTYYKETRRHSIPTDSKEISFVSPEAVLTEPPENYDSPYTIGCDPDFLRICTEIGTFKRLFTNFKYIGTKKEEYAEITHAPRFVARYSIEQILQYASSKNYYTVSMLDKSCESAFDVEPETFSEMKELAQISGEIGRLGYGVRKRSLKVKKGTRRKKRGMIGTKRRVKHISKTHKPRHRLNK
jgi:hypothetical protein